LAERGARVVVADVDEDGGRSTADMASGKGGVAVYRRCDVTRTENLRSAFGLAVERFGRLDIAFNNAGVGGDGLFDDDPGDWKRVVDIDLVAVIDATRLVVREMRRAGTPGAVVNTASLIGLWPMPGAPVYAAAKAGVVNFTRSLGYLADESGIRVNAICPELVDTPMALALGVEQLEELRRSGGILTPEAIADGVVELVEDDSRAGAIMQITSSGGREYVTA
jgi:NAD(P)-dependent dehydrogenase (short-subunit alcohol dehydrogenase family)